MKKGCHQKDLSLRNNKRQRGRERERPMRPCSQLNKIGTDVVDQSSTSAKSTTALDRAIDPSSIHSTRATTFNQLLLLLESEGEKKGSNKKEMRETRSNAISCQDSVRSATYAASINHDCRYVKATEQKQALPFRIDPFQSCALYTTGEKRRTRKLQETLRKWLLCCLPLSLSLSSSYSFLPSSSRAEEAEEERIDINDTLGEVCSVRA